MKACTDTCTILSSLSPTEIDDFIRRAAVEELTFRRTLNFSDLYSFGNEIEVNNMVEYNPKRFVEDFNDDHALFDDEMYVEVDEPTAEAEIVTPILTNQQYNWIHLKDMYDRLRKCGAEIGANTASHIHVGTHFVNTPGDLALLLKTLVVFQPIIYKFGYGYDDEPRDFIVASYNANNYCMFMTPGRVEKFVDCLENFDYANRGVMYNQYLDFTSSNLGYRPVYSFINFRFSKFFYPSKYNVPDCNDHMEVRCFNGSLDPAIVQNNINLVVNIFRAIHEGSIDREYIEREYERYLDTNNYDFDYTGGFFMNTNTVDDYNKILYSFSEVDMDKAIKFADMMYTTDKDKLLFLKQYLKLFDTKKKL